MATFALLDRPAPPDGHMVRRLLALLGDGRGRTTASLALALYGDDGSAERAAVRQLVYRLRRAGARLRAARVGPGRRLAYRLVWPGPHDDRPTSRRQGTRPSWDAPPPEGAP